MVVLMVVRGVVMVAGVVVRHHRRGQHGQDCEHAGQGHRGLAISDQCYSCEKRKVDKYFPREYISMSVSSSDPNQHSCLHTVSIFIYILDIFHISPVEDELINVLTCD